MKYKTINMYLSPLSSEVSQMKITNKCNDMSKKGCSPDNSMGEGFFWNNKE